MTDDTRSDDQPTIDVANADLLLSTTRSVRKRLDFERPVERVAKGHRGLRRGAFADDGDVYLHLLKVEWSRRLFIVRPHHEGRRFEPVAPNCSAHTRKGHDPC